MRKRAVKNALQFIPDARQVGSGDFTGQQRKYKKRVWKSLSWKERERLVRVGNKILEKAKVAA
jgi:hypothetical protein